MTTRTLPDRDCCNPSAACLVCSRKHRLPSQNPPRSPQPAPALVPPPRKAKAASSQIPGVWLIYFSLAALPVFGLGQTLLPADDASARHQGFIYLFFYLAAALGLLVTTSFLGLRRYLRQRYLVMPGNIAFGWVQFGVVGAAVVLCLCLLLPRPGGGEAWGSLRYHVDYQLRRASEFAARFNPHGSGSGRSGNQTPPAGQPQNPPSQSGSAPNPDQNQNSGRTSSERTTFPSTLPTRHTTGRRQSGKTHAQSVSLGRRRLSVAANLVLARRRARSDLAALPVSGADPDDAAERLGSHT